MAVHCGNVHSEMVYNATSTHELVVYTQSSRAASAMAGTARYGTAHEQGLSQFKINKGIFFTIYCDFTEAGVG